ncbi:hypothetical protein [Streptomyces sp. NPDC020571]|uniref:hypothetical protein n=1 Tax=Streptomyces sp. NPDC020571 TaxID=3365079 RepID=UPI00379ED850
MSNVTGGTSASEATASGERDSMVWLPRQFASETPGVTHGVLGRVIERGQRVGEFDDRLPVDWLVASTMALGHTATKEQDAGRLPDAVAQDVLRVSLLRLLGAAEPADALS